MFNKLIGNRVAEKDIRDWLESNGYFGSSAKFDHVELHAIGRPGWLQVFRFVVTAKSTAGDWEEIHGVMRDDERYRRTEIRIFESVPEQVQLLDEWSAGLIVKRRRRQ